LDENTPRLYHDIFALKYHDNIMIYIIDIYHWYFRDHPDRARSVAYSR